VSLRNYLPPALAIVLTIASPAFAADMAPFEPLKAPAAPIPDVEYFTPNPAPAIQAEFGARYWFGTGKTGKSLYGPPSVYNGLVSRLTYSDFLVNAGEFDWRVAFLNGWFIKGYIGGGSATQGQLQDEDFPPALTPYSSTTSREASGFLGYGSVDVGYDVLRGGDFRVGAFVGYHYLNQGENAYGCAQNAANPLVCQPPIPATIEAISQSNTYQSLRLGLDASVQLGERFTLTGEGAWLPYVSMKGSDTHWLRIAEGDFSGPIPEGGTGQGFQLETVLSYKVTSYASVGIGARYWHMETSGNAQFEDVAIGGMPQPVDWKTDVYGGFVQASFKFGPYPLGMR
jgi:outer membrane protease